MTTILAVKRGGQIAIAGDGQITVGDVVMKHTANKLRTLYHGQVLTGFAGAVADALTLSERFEGHLERHGGQLRKAAVELAKEWRTDRVLRRLDALLDECVKRIKAEGRIKPRALLRIRKAKEQFE